MPRTLIVFLAILASLALLALLAIRPAGADLVLNEVLYDPDGADQGYEFVEIWNPDTVAVSLEGVRIESGDGSRPGVWTLVYAGAPGDSVPPRHSFLVSGTALLSAIQNGPDALRLSRAGVTLDLLGYGDLTSAELYEGAPAADAPSGASLARVEDGRDSGTNAADWAPESDPTPGLPNHPDVRLSIARGSAGLAPEVPWPGDATTVRVAVRNLGRLDVPAGRWRLEVSMRAAPEGSAWSDAPVAVCAGFSIASGESVSAACALTPPLPGRFDLRVILRDLESVAGGLLPAVADTVVIRARSTAGPLVINEIAFRDGGAGEWVELIAREDIPDVGIFALSDAAGRAYAIDRGAAPRPVRAGELLVVAESPELVRASYALAESLVLGCRGGWPALNDSDGEDGFADRVRVLDSLGIAADAVPYRSEYAERDGSIERLGTTLSSASAGSWSETIDPRGGTPGRPNSMQAPGAGAASTGAFILASSRVLRRPPGAPVAPVVLAFGAEARGKRVRVLVHDLLGRTRRLLLDGQRVLGEAAFVWDGRDDAGAPVAAGTYVVRAEAIPDGSEPAKSGTLAITVADPWVR
jgi:lamin tail-like protein/flagellar hook capping protein FlgD